MAAASRSQLEDRHLGEDGPETIYDDASLRISGLRGGDKTLFVAFTGIGHRLGALQQEEFVRVAHAGGDNSVLFVQDKTRTWYNQPDVAEKLGPVVADWAGRCGKTVTIGNSMGGFGAVVLAGALGADTAIAFSPQFSVSPKVVPQETRWRAFTSQIAEFRYASAAEHMVEACDYFIFQGDGGKDWFQIGGFPIGPNVFQFVVPDAPHNLAAELKARGDLGPIVAACARGDRAFLRSLLVDTGTAVLRSAADDPYRAPERPVRDKSPVAAATLPGADDADAVRARKRIERREAKRDSKKAARIERKQAEKAAAAPSIVPGDGEQAFGGGGPLARLGRWIVRQAAWPGGAR